MMLTAIRPEGLLKVIRESSLIHTLSQCPYDQLSRYAVRLALESLSLQ